MDELALIVAVVVLLFIVLIGPLLLLRVLFPVHGGSIAVGMIVTSVFVPFAIWMFLRGSRHPEWTVLRHLRETIPLLASGLIGLAIIDGIIEGFDRGFASDIAMALAVIVLTVTIPFLLGRAIARRRLARTSEQRQAV